eukprot:CAMPEP_0185037446 /NCGR_PEP_ID=MMETSP1103-20130426/31882_1 /TAXON_ID=36769 /ORGANISM="Paraphysomonas bandaiensis, Strain Caron Lab Isolate" /LENGTH=1289 /DNA_ID=CAMNT_0027575425 /DNA_START=341 /DNA_END=4210 /DNA_ORIENTATION=-
MFTFIPRSLFEQFRRLANVYFLLISILMLIGTYTLYYDSPLDPWSTLIPLIIVLVISICKEGAEDLKRHRADKQTNYRVAQKISSSPTETTQDLYWQDIRVGDIILLHNNDEIPADMILLSSSEGNGVVYIETANIDGETNLKLKNSARTTRSGPAWQSPQDIKDLQMIIQCEHPNSSIHHFNGTLFWEGKEIAVDSSNFLLRGSAIRNTSWALGAVVYTGQQSKIVLNSRRAPSKMSSVERSMNNLIYLVFSAQVLLSTLSLICYIVWSAYYYSQLMYLCYNYESSSNPLYRDGCIKATDYSDSGYFFTFFILYCNFLPISLYVTVEFCNYIQAFYIDNDLEMYDKNTDTPALARTSNMNGDLGMIEYVFSDKTGTLTQNVMTFRQCSIGGEVYGDSPSESSDDDTRMSTLRSSGTINGKSLDVLRERSGEVQSVYADFVFVLSVAHTVVIDRDTGAYQSESPDEFALVQAGRELGWKFVKRTPEYVTVTRLRSGEPATEKLEEMKFEILATIPFDSTRKRMSVIVKHPISGETVLFCKGADNIIFDRSVGYAAGSTRENLERHLGMFASDGLRTLALARRTLTADDVERFMSIWREAEGSVVGRSELVARAAALVEKSLTVLGVTAIEDKLQEGVPQTIADLGNAGVKFWVLTGDKVETAINIGYSCRLLGPEMVLIRLQETGEGLDVVKHRIEVLLRQLKCITEDTDTVGEIWSSVQEAIKSSISPLPQSPSLLQSLISSYCSNSNSASKPLTSNAQYTGTTSLGGGMGNDSSGHERQDSHAFLDRPPQSPALEDLTSDHLALIVDGDMLTRLLGDPHAEKLLLILARICKSVLACRVSPEQKRLLVKLVKRGISPHPITLAIGDGANDVAMIQEAQVGVGISGKEGRQAVNSSDFAIAQFRFLKRLMLVHGRTDYRRVSKVVLYSFYKNIVLTFTLFFFQFFCGYSGLSFFDDYIYSSYNFILAFPVIGFGIFDQDISAESLQKHNMLYVTGRERQDMNIAVLGKQLLQATVDAVIIYFIPYANFHVSDVNTENGKLDGIWVFGSTVFTCLILSQLARCAWLTYTWTWLSVLFWLGSALFFYLFILSYQYIAYFYDYYNVTTHMMDLPLFWMLCFLVPVMTMGVEVTLSLIQREFYPTLIDVCVEYDRGYGNSDEGMRGQNMFASPEGSDSYDAEARLRLSNIAGKRKFPLDWKSIKEMYGRLGIDEREGLGMHNTSEGPRASSFNFDYVTREYGPGAGLMFISNAFQKVGNAIFESIRGTTGSSREEFSQPDVGYKDPTNFSME